MKTHRRIRVRLNADTSYVMAAAFVVALPYVVSGFTRASIGEPSDLDPRIVKVVQSVSEDRLVAILKKLESFGTRSTLSSTDKPDRGIGAARDWILKEMSNDSPRLQVSFDSYRVAKQGRITRDVEVRNVMAVLPGRSARRVYVSGHYDTIAIARGAAVEPPRDSTTGDILFADPDSRAPGVDDDGSGTALT